MPPAAAIAAANRAVPTCSPTLFQTGAELVRQACISVAVGIAIFLVLSAARNAAEYSAMALEDSAPDALTNAAVTVVRSEDDNAFRLRVLAINTDPRYKWLVLVIVPPSFEKFGD